MQLTLWTYEGPPHVGAMRVATSMEGVHYVLHAPQGDTYADLLFTMIERRAARPPVTYTTFQARDLGGDTANLVVSAVREAYQRFAPRALLVGDSCTAELIQDQSGALAMGMQLPIPVVPLELPAYSKKENWGAAETFYQLVRALVPARAPGAPRPPRPGGRPRANLLGPTSLGFRSRDDVREVTQLLASVGVDVHVVAPLGATPEQLRTLTDADFNVVLHAEIALTTASWLHRVHGMPMVRTVPIGVGATSDFLAEVGRVAEVDVSPALDAASSRLPWYSRSVDSTYLTGKRVFIFADGTHAVAAARIARDELGFTVVGLGTYSREMAREVREAAAAHGLEALICDDYLEVEAAIAAAAPELVLGTQMERHIAKRLHIPCAVISGPFHVQDVPARHSPQMGWEGANVIFDTWVHPLMMGLEEHLITMFREDFEFGDHAGASHLGKTAGGAAVLTAAVDPPATRAPAAPDVRVPSPAASLSAPEVRWSADGERELKKIPFFVRKKARLNTERFAAERGVDVITVETLYEAKAHYGK
ncbi:MAG: ferredoxin:protochlorophyllide reductase (ATP-dependent) subunit B [Gemmatimonadaceae bacterium]|nr:ferredoxin:protochlorophyllide reductase (ATP-dependent) subunit B [Gemmatimonadaceae bacterium]